MSGKHQRTEKVNFLGMKYKEFICTKCKGKFEDFGLNKGRKICPPCDNPEPLDDYVNKRMDYSKSFDECFRDQAKLVREWNDKSKET